MVDGERRKVAEVAAEFGCTPANIYALLGKLRQAGTVDPVPETVAPPAIPAPDLFAAAATELPALPAPAAKPAPALKAPVPKAPASKAPASKAPAPKVQAAVADPPQRGPGKSRGVGAAAAKPGFGLVMRSAEGEEAMTPFRSLDDLLSAVKPILRAAARSPDAVWFSIQPIDLATLDGDAA